MDSVGDSDDFGVLSVFLRAFNGQKSDELDVKGTSEVKYTERCAAKRRIQSTVSVKQRNPNLDLKKSGPKRKWSADKPSTSLAIPANFTVSWDHSDTDSTNFVTVAGREVCFAAAALRRVPYAPKLGRYLTEKMNVMYGCRSASRPGLFYAFVIKERRGAVARVNCQRCKTALYSLRKLQLDVEAQSEASQQDKTGYGQGNCSQDSEPELQQFQEAGEREAKKKPRVDDLRLRNYRLNENEGDHPTIRPNPDEVFHYCAQTSFELNADSFSVTQLRRAAHLELECRPTDASSTTRKILATTDAVFATSECLEQMRALVRNPTTQRQVQKHLCKIADNLQQFVRLTKSTEDPAKRNAVLMGRKCWESIPPKFRPLPDRLNVVLSTTMPPQSTADLLVLPDLDSALGRLHADPTVEAIWNIGGGDLYRLGLRHPTLNQVYLTRLDRAFDTDRRFPPLDLAQLELTEQHPPVQEKQLSWQLMVYRNKASLF